ncbi:hypothetical protein PLEOSDRAFT_161660 [Pleurotus ostreatus PC15]|uniref:F-box domain-containing protein n=2 Tax=Pleurotus TaxID=5320 RepID=A0A067N8Z9_PLEO1|nr:hypothetical protein CCMSSC00406_0002337 [Pleurotus cornucopiae]KDQ24304.1 hypothetical protein PLEOSDRAFT_161660 [Pleurotus ostreatus PC15]
MFLHPTVINLSIHYLDGFSLLGAILSSLPTKTPAITDIFITGSVAIAGDNTSNAIAMLAEALPGLTLLRSLTLPIPWFTPAMVDAVASCSSLHKLSTSTLADEGANIELFDYDQLYSLSLPSSGFPAISILSVVLPFPRAAKFISQGSHFNTLTRFEAQSPDSIVEPHEYKVILSALSKYCPNLETITLCATVPRGDAREDDAITYRELSSITQFTALRLVSFRHIMPFQLDTKNIVAIARALPNLTTLVLNPDPHFPTASPLAVSVLSVLRDLCPNLVSLGLYVNAADEHIPPPPANDDEHRRALPASAEFTSLKRFAIGWSSLLSPISLAVYLSSVLPDDCALDPSLNAKHWDEVRRLIPVFKQVRAQGVRTGRITCDHSD